MRVPVTLTADLQALDEANETIGRDAHALVDGLSDAQGTWQRAPGTWSVAECLDHLAVGNRVYVAAMEPLATRARAGGRLRIGEARPGLIGGWFAQYLEPPVKRGFRMRAPPKIVPRASPATAESRKPKAGSRKLEAGSWKPEAGSRKPEAECWKPEADNGGTDRQYLTSK